MDDCSICLNPLVPAQNIFTCSNCTTTFHFRCIEKWVYKTYIKRNCPICRGIIEPENINFNRKYYRWSWSLEPEPHTPSGMVNLTRLLTPSSIEINGRHYRPDELPSNISGQELYENPLYNFGLHPDMHMILPLPHDPNSARIPIPEHQPRPMGSWGGQTRHDESANGRLINEVYTNVRLPDIPAPDPEEIQPSYWPGRIDINDLIWTRPQPPYRSFPDLEGPPTEWS